MDENGVAEGSAIDSSDPGGISGGIGRSRFLAAAGGTLFGLATGLTAGVQSASAATKYPGAIDETLKPEEEGEAILAIENELGANPSGSAATVKAALEEKLPLTVFHLTSYGAVGDGTTNDAPALREAFEDATEVAEKGGVAIVQANGRKTYKLNSGTKGGAVAIPHNLSGRLEFHGDGCKFLFTSNVRHLFDCVEGAKHDFIRNFLAEDFTIDAGEFHKAGFKEHIVFGNEIEGTIQKYLQFENITLRRWTVINGYTHGADGETETCMTGVYIRLKQEGKLSEEATQDVAKNIVLAEWRMKGGLVGIDVGGESSKRVGSGEEEHSDLANVMIDEVYVEDWYHSVGKEFSRGLASSSIQIGHFCIGGTFTVRNGFSEYAGDVGVEIDFVEKCVVENVTVKDSRNSCFLSPGMGKPLRGVGLQYFLDCRAIRERESGDCVGYLQAEGAGNSGNGAPHVYYENCSFYSSRPQIDNADQAWFMKGGSEHVSLSNCRAEIVGLAQSSESEVEAPIFVLGTTANTTFRVRGFDLRVSGEDKHAHLKPIFLQLSGSAGVQRVLDVRGVTIRDELVGGAKGSRYTKVAVGATEVTFRGFLEVAVLADGNSEESTAVYFYKGARINGRLNVTVDARGMDDTKSKTFTFDGEFPEEQRASVRIVNSNFKEAPAKAAVTVGSSPFVYWNVDGYAERLTVRGGTVSKIELNGADVGTTAGVFPVDPGDKLTVTYSAKPTMEKVPVP
jgi:hypothetical protein